MGSFGGLNPDNHVLNMHMAVSANEEEEQSLELAQGQPWVWSVSDFIFLASAYEGGWPVLSLTVSSAYWQCAISVLIIGELARGCKWSANDTS